ncbi:hypothetical protein SKAU_G00153240 [Synaphobranchus kaupii]|uniref:Uncharacterized protein n=1 Tax=Synaphobranchus kaupii TaxID=118154 RepID=A0A9Q1IWW6_SYNKA|nr:hypothetical protein SKAU_G00153240 [Synaphobranchus kaupii]
MKIITGPVLSCETSSAHRKSGGSRVKGLTYKGGKNGVPLRDVRQASRGGDSLAWAAAVCETQIDIRWGALGRQEEDSHLQTSAWISTS